ncbi:MAG: hypothetical protein LBV26_07560, partial [Bacteroidales bacterium]|nr:hypothetical protein [Bacteroidales bacterium]
MFKKLLLSIVSLFLWVAGHSQFSGGTGTAASPYVITTPSQLDAIRSGMDRHYKLGNDIDLTGYLSPGGAGYAQWGDAGWLPIGVYSSDGFTGSLDGDGHRITGLMINRSSNYVGLFSYTWNATIKNLGIEISPSGIRGNNYVGGLAGVQNRGYVTNSHVAGKITGHNYIGGMTGLLHGAVGSVSESYFTGDVTGSVIVGGLAGQHINGISITGCYVTGNIRGKISIGGLAGRNSASPISGSYFSGTVTAGSDAGNSNAGGLVGYQENGGIITDSYATGIVTAAGSRAGGLIGHQIAGSIVNSYAANSVSGASNAGGLIGYQENGGSATECFFDMHATGQAEGVGNTANASGITGKPTEQMRQQATFAGWDFTGTWHIWATKSYPYFQPQSAPATGTVITASGISFELRNAADSVEVYNRRTQLATVFYALPVGTSVRNYVSQPGDVLYFTVYESGMASSYRSVAVSGFSGGDGTPATPYIITTPAQLDAMRLNMPAHYRLGSDIDLTAYLAPGGAGYAQWGDAGWMPVGTYTANDITAIFSGSLDGDGHRITGLWIDRSDVSYVGLFGYTRYAAIRNLVLEISSAGVNGASYVGGLAGYYRDGSSVTGCRVTGSVSGVSYVGGLVGVQGRGNIVNSYSSCTVNSTSVAGSLAGAATGDITGCYATGSVTVGNNTGGGLVGSYNTGVITNSYATGSVSGKSHIGGLLGWQSSGSIENSYATGSVNGVSHAGGFLGYQAGGNIENSYAAGNVNGGINTGGFIGYQTGASVTAGCFFDRQATGQAEGTGNISGAAGITGKTTEQMRQQATFAGWDFTDAWYIWDTKSYPYFQNQSAPASGTVITASGISFELRNSADSVEVYNCRTQSIVTFHAPLAAGAISKNLASQSGDTLLLTVYETGKTPSYAAQVPENFFTFIFSGGKGTSVSPYIITTPAQLDAMRLNLTAHYRLGSDIDLSAYLSPGGAGYAQWGDAGWLPVGTYILNDITVTFRGSLDGGGYRITGLWIDRSDVNYVGLFGYTRYVTIKNLGLEISSAGVRGASFVGGIVGYKYGGNDGIITDCRVTGSISGASYTGGLVGFQNRGNIVNSYTACTVSSNTLAGGLAG